VKERIVVGRQAFINRFLITYARHFPVAKGKERVLSFFLKNLPREEQVQEAQLEFDSLRMRCDLTKRIQRRLYFYGTYEEEECRHWEQRAKSARIIIDVGANVGLYSLVGAAANPQAEIHSFEPTPNIFETFVHNIRLNKLTNITANQAGVAREPGTAFLQFCAGEGGTNDGMNYVSPTNEANVGINVEITSLDAYCRARGIDSIDLLKMDIEGGEYSALQGAEGLLSGHAVKCMFLELTEWAANRSGASTRDIKGLLREHGYHIYTFKHSKFVPVPLEGTHNGLNVVAFPNPVP
jgi:FkbM family methyltransferase